MKTTNVFFSQSKVSTIDFENKNGHKGCVIWLTGLSASGKSSIAIETQKALFNLGYNSYILDGDNIRQGLNKDLGFSPEDRAENIRRIAHVAKLFRDSGQIVIVAFISPYKSERQLARDLIEKDRFIEVFVKCPIDVCRKRDPKGLYEKAINGLIKDFTGINAPYEEPESPEIVLNTDILSIYDSAEEIIKKLKNLNIISL